MSFEEQKPEIESKVVTPVTPARWYSNPILLWGVRIAQFVFAIICLGLSAKVLAFGINHSTTGYAVAVSVITIVYLVVVTLVPFRLNDCVVFILVSEIVLSILWFAALIALAVLHGGIDCGNRYTFSSGWLEYCRVGQASIAMAFFPFWLFDITAALFWLNVMAPIRSVTEGGWVYKGGPKVLTRWCNLSISDVDSNLPMRTDVESQPRAGTPIVSHTDVDYQPHPEQSTVTNS